MNRNLEVEGSADEQIERELGCLNDQDFVRKDVL